VRADALGLFFWDEREAEGQKVTEATKGVVE